MLTIFIAISFSSMCLQIFTVCYNSGWEERHRYNIRALLARRFNDDHAPCIGSITPHLLPAYCEIYEQMFPYRETMELRF